MRKNFHIIKIFLTAVFVIIFIVKQSLADENIIQQEKIDFEKCKKIISMSSDKLATAPDISDLENEKRVAVFKLVDGTLTITCNGETGFLTVSTKSK